MVHASLCFPYMYTLSSNSPIFLINHVVVVIIWTWSELVCVGWLVSPGFVPLPSTPCSVWPLGSHVAPPWAQSLFHGEKAKRLPDGSSNLLSDLICPATCRCRELLSTVADISTLVCTNCAGIYSSWWWKLLREPWPFAFINQQHPVDRAVINSRARMLIGDLDGSNAKNQRNRN